MQTTHRVGVVALFIGLSFAACSDDAAKSKKNDPVDAQAPTSDATALVADTAPPATTSPPPPPGPCPTESQACTITEPCCDGFTCVAETGDPNQLVNFSQNGTCARDCLSSAECLTGCCLQLRGFKKVCAPALACPVPEGGTPVDAATDATSPDGAVDARTDSGPDDAASRG